MATVLDEASDGLSFGPFNLVATERLLTKDGVPIDLGARALDMLIALISAPNEVVSKKDLMARLWPDVTVEGFVESLRLSRRVDGARAWELRTATDLTASHWAGQGRAEDGRALLRPVVEQFNDGLDTPDLKAARDLLTTLG